MVAVVANDLSRLHRKGWRIGLEHHSVLPGPNPGWSEATMAGVLQRRLIGPIWKDGALITKLWIGDPDDPDFRKGSRNLIRISLGWRPLFVLLAGAQFFLPTLWYFFCLFTIFNTFFF